MFKPIRLEGNGTTLRLTGPQDVAWLMAVSEGGDLDLVDLRIEGGPIYNEGSLLLRDVTYDDVDAPALVNHFADEYDVSGDMTLDTVTFDGPGLRGPGYLVENGWDATLRIEDSAFSNLFQVAGISNSGIVSVTDTDVHDVVGYLDSFESPESIVFLRSVGEADVVGLDARNTTEGSVILSGGTLSVSSSTIDGCHGPVGGIDTRQGTVTIENTTISGCSGDEAGALACSSGQVSLSGVTMTGNTGLRAGGVQHTCSVTAESTEITGNTPVDCDGAIEGSGNVDSDGTCFF